MASDGATKIIQDLDAARGDLRARVEVLRQGPAGDDVMAGGWMVREMLGHVGFWTEAAPPVITYMWRGKEIPDGWRFGSGYRSDNSAGWPPFPVHNAREGAWAKEQTFDAVLERWDKAYAALLPVVETVTDEEAVTQAEYYAGLAEHLREHLAELG